MNPLPPVMEADEVAALLKCSKRTVDYRARAGTLPDGEFR